MPVWLKQVKPGPHDLRVARLKTVVFVEPGQTLTLSHFKVACIIVPEQNDVSKEPARAPETLMQGSKRMKPPDEEKPTNLTCWGTYPQRNTRGPFS